MNKKIKNNRPPAMNYDTIWQAALGEIELSISKANFTTWFKNTFILEYTGDHIVIGVPNAFTKAWLENKYNTHIGEALQNVTDKPIHTIAYKVAVPKETGTPKTQKMTQTSQNNIEPKQVVISPRTQVPRATGGLNPKYIFENFVVGKESELAHAACEAVSEKPGFAYNPLFIYGGVGLGKTHLMQAVGNRILQNSPDKKNLYVTSETFTNEFITSIKQGRAEDFKNKYRSIDALLVDDIQFISGKEQTQEAFFHTFNHLHQLNKQIVITSDRLPKAISSLEGRLLSRFEWGMIVDIGKPNLETRIAILKAKCEEKYTNLPEEVINYIASNIQNNIRELEGALNRVLAMQQLNHIEPTLENAKNILSNIIKPRYRGALTSRQIIDTVSNFFDIKKEDLTGCSRKRELVVPRQIAMYLMRVEMKSSFPNIGHEFGGRDHTTAMHSHEKIYSALKEDDSMRQNINLLKERLYE